MAGMAPTTTTPVSVTLTEDGTDVAAITITLSPDAVAVIAGLVAPSDAFNRDGIYTTEEVWAEIRTAFPHTAFLRWAEAHPDVLDSGGQGYDPEAGM